MTNVVLVTPMDPANTLDGSSYSGSVGRILQLYGTALILKIHSIEESKDLSSLALDELIRNLKAHEVVMEKDSEIYRGKRERVKSIALKAKKESSDDETSTSGSDDEEYAMAGRGTENALDAVIQIVSLAIVQNQLATKIKRPSLEVLGAIAKITPKTKLTMQLVSWLNHQMRFLEKEILELNEKIKKLERSKEIDIACLGFDSSKASTSGTKLMSFVGSSAEKAMDGSTIKVHSSTLPGSVCLRTCLEPDEWIKDSGSSKHMIGNKSLSSTYKAYDGGNAIFGSNFKGKITGKGLIETPNITSTHTPNKLSNLLIKTPEQLEAQAEYITARLASARAAIEAQAAPSACSISFFTFAPNMWEYALLVGEDKSVAHHGKSVALDLRQQSLRQHLKSVALGIMQHFSGLIQHFTSVLYPQFENSKEKKSGRSGGKILKMWSYISLWARIMFPFTLSYHVILIDFLYLLLKNCSVRSFGEFSKSKGVGVFGNNVKDTDIPVEVSDTLFTWADLQAKLNSELLNNLGNFFNHVLSFIAKPGKFLYLTNLYPVCWETLLEIFTIHATMAYLGAGKGSGYNFIIPDAPSAESHLLTKALADSIGNYVKLKQGLKIAMSISGEGNAYLQESLEALQGRPSFLLLSHENFGGSSLSSCVPLRTFYAIIYMTNFAA
ncbi:hypothetical protein Tco_1193396 [Tanacetum coccineum]